MIARPLRPTRAPGRRSRRPRVRRSCAGRSAARGHRRGAARESHLGRRRHASGSRWLEPRARRAPSGRGRRARRDERRPIGGRVDRTRRRDAGPCRRRRRVGERAGSRSAPARRLAPRRTSSSSPPSRARTCDRTLDVKDQRSALQTLRLRSGRHGQNRTGSGSTPRYAVRAALRQLPPVGKDSSGPLGPGLLASGLLGTIIRDLQAGLADPDHRIATPAWNYRASQ